MDIDSEITARVLVVGRAVTNNSYLTQALYDGGILRNFSSVSPKLMGVIDSGLEMSHSFSGSLAAPFAYPCRIGIGVE